MNPLQDIAIDVRFKLRNVHEGGWNTERAQAGTLYGCMGGATIDPAFNRHALPGLPSTFLAAGSFGSFPWQCAGALQ